MTTSTSDPKTADLIRQRAADLAGDLLMTEDPDDRRIGRLWLRVLSRPATPEERDEALAFLKDSRAGAESGEALSAWTELARALFGTNEFLLRF